MTILKKALSGLCLTVFAAATAVLGAELQNEQAAPSVNEYVLSCSTDFSMTSDAVFGEYVSINGTELKGKTLAEVQQWLDDYIDHHLNRHVTLNVLGQYFEYDISSFGMTLNNPEDTKDLDQYLLTGNFVQMYTKQKDLQNSPAELTTDFSVDEKYIASLVHDYCATFTSNPVNASLVKGDEGFVVVEGSLGRVFDENQVRVSLTEQLLEDSDGSALVYEFPHTDVTPQYVGADLNFTYSLLGEYTTKDLGNEARRTNIALSASGINGSVVYPGEKFSALTWYGDVTEENGYQVAPTYQDGQQLPGVGGGICQTTTTLYNAVLLAELGVAFRSPHSMMVAYVPPSRDAMVDYKSGSDFIGYNNKEYPVYFEAFVSGDTLTVRIWGRETRPANRTVEYRYEVITCVYPDPLYSVEAVNDDICLVGAYYIADKMSEEVAPHPYVVSKLWKDVYVDGVLQSIEIVNPEVRVGANDGYDEYKQMQGQFYHASDCVVVNTLKESADAFTGFYVDHQCYFPDGKTTWNEYWYEAYYNGTLDEVWQHEAEERAKKEEAERQQNEGEVSN